MRLSKPDKVEPEMSALLRRNTQQQPRDQAFSNLIFKSPKLISRQGERSGTAGEKQISFPECVYNQKKRPLFTIKPNVCCVVL